MMSRLISARMDQFSLGTLLNISEIQCVILNRQHWLQKIMLQYIPVIVIYLLNDGFYVLSSTST